MKKLGTVDRKEKLKFSQLHSSQRLKLNETTVKTAV